MPYLLSEGFSLQTVFSPTWTPKPATGTPDPSPLSEIGEKTDFAGVRIRNMIGVRNGDDWIATQATIFSVKSRLFPWKNGGWMDYPPPEYVVTFSYKVGGRVITGKYVTTATEEPGHKFDIFYDPKHPERNTGLDEPFTPLGKWIAGIIGIGLVIAGTWLWGDQDWFWN